MVYVKRPVYGTKRIKPAGSWLYKLKKGKMNPAGTGGQGFRAVCQRYPEKKFLFTCFVASFIYQPNFDCMQYTTLKKRFAQLVAFTTIFLLGFTHSAVAGLDSYEIYLNNKLLVKQTVDKPLSLESLRLDKSNANDQLVIYYSQCNAPNKIAKGRKLVITDANGQVVKEWKFADVQNANTGMTIPVRELLQLEKRAGAVPLSLVYTAEGHVQGQKLTSVQIGARSTTHRYYKMHPAITTSVVRFIGS